MIMSSCSGRISVMAEATEKQDKKGGDWLFVSHDPISTTTTTTTTTSTTDDLDILLAHKPRCSCADPLPSTSSLVAPQIIFKFEPFILHTEARSLQHAQRLVSIGMASGFRNSGILISSSDRYMVAFRHTMKLDVPIGIRCACGGLHLMVHETYLKWLVEVANGKFEQNRVRMHGLLENLRREFDPSADRDGGEGTLETKQERRERKQREGLLRQQAMRDDAIIRAEDSSET